MKTVFIYSGGMRSFDRTWRNHQWFIWRHFKDARFYCCTEDDEDAHKVSFLPPGATVRKVKQPEMVMPAGCPPTWTQGQPYMHEPYAISVPPSAVMGQLWMLREGWRLYEEGGEQADLVIRIRPDLWFHSFEKPERQIWESDLALVPWWGRFGGCNDRFALLRPSAAAEYFIAYDKIPALISIGAPLHPETIIAESIGRMKICPTLKAEFSTLRKSGEMRPPEISLIDLAHASMK